MSGKAIPYRHINANVTIGLHAQVKSEAARLNVPMNVFFVRSLRAALPQVKRKYSKRKVA